jgi:hypothetical protein
VELPHVPIDEQAVRAKYKSGCTPTDIIRFIKSECPEAGAGDMQQVFMNVFRLSFRDSIAASQWWIDGSFGTDEATINARLTAVIEARRTAWDV